MSRARTFGCWAGDPSGSSRNRYEWTAGEAASDVTSIWTARSCGGLRGATTWKRTGTLRDARRAGARVCDGW
jgi:hypothetical protein